MSATLLSMEKEVLEEGREWTRRRFQERLQEAADAILPVCEQSGLVLKRQRKISFPLITVSGTVSIEAIRGHSSATGSWHCPVREQWGLAKWARLSPELEQRLAYNAAVTGSYEKAAEHAKRWGTAISDDAIHALVGRVAERNKGAALPPPPPPKSQEQPFSVVIMIDGWMVRQRGMHWGVEPGPPGQERVSWKEVKSAIVYRLEDRAANASGRGMLIEKKVVAVPPETDVLDLGARIQEQAMHLGLARAKEVFVVADGALWIWNLIEDRFRQATKTLDFYHGSEHLWSLAHHLHPDSPELAAAWIKPLLHQLRHTTEHRVIHTLEELLAGNPADQIINREVTYFQNHRDHLKYADLAARNAPIGSGSMESACGQFQDRLKRRGQFWSPRGLADMLAIDVAVKNDTLQFLWN
ncbi:MAG: hypothetical protein ACOYM3_34635 [Terrimicrobiaceae bacterium]